ncbi:DsbA family protein [Ottowia thiooxydans]
MNKTLYYVFDPLCGWCYGAGEAVATLNNTPGVQLQLLPSGLFSGEGARPMDVNFANYAWSNDQRIERLTGQRFTDRYRGQVLADRGQMFDSGPATVALTAVALTSPDRELEALKAIQMARYVEGQDITQLSTLVSVLRSLGLEQAAGRLSLHDEDLLVANCLRISDAQALLGQFGARGVPAFVLDTGPQRQLMHSSAVYSDPHAFLDQVRAA